VLLIPRSVIDLLNFLSSTTLSAFFAAQVLKALQRVRAATLTELAIEQRAGINLPIPSSSCRYSAVAFLMQSGSFNPSVTYFRKPLTAQARIPGASAFSLSGRLWSI
jgi:hypothetical protein